MKRLYLSAASAVLLCSAALAQTPTGGKPPAAASAGSQPINPLTQEKKMLGFKGKRIAPKEVTPLTVNGVRYESVVNGRPLGYEHRGGILAAFDAQSNDMLWHLQIYRTEYNERLEKDVQESYITTIETDDGGKTLLITNERSRRFRLNLADRTVTTLD